MNQTSPRRIAPSSRFSTVYTGIWTVLAVAALAYIAVLAIQPSLLAGLASPAAEPPTHDFSQTASRFATDITGIRSDVNAMAGEVAALKTVVAAGDERSKEVMSRLAAVEEKVKQPVVAAATPVAAPKTAAQRLAEAKATKAAQRVQAAAAQAPQVAEQGTAAPSERVTVLNASTPNPTASSIATGSLQVPPPAQGVPAPAPVIPFGPGAIKAAPQPAGVELSSGPSLDALRLNWSLLADKNAALQSLEPRYTSAGEGQPYQLVAGPIGSPEEAARVCAQLKAKRVSCRVTGFGGNAL